MRTRSRSGKPANHPLDPCIPDFVWRWTGQKANLRDALLTLDEESREEAARILSGVLAEWRRRRHPRSRPVV